MCIVTTPILPKSLHMFTRTPSIFVIPKSLCKYLYRYAHWRLWIGHTLYWHSSYNLFAFFDLLCLRVMQHTTSLKSKGGIPISVGLVQGFSRECPWQKLSKRVPTTESSITLRRVHSKCILQLFTRKPLFLHSGTPNQIWAVSHGRQEPFMFVFTNLVKVATEGKLINDNELWGKLPRCKKLKTIAWAVVVPCLN